MKNRGGRLTSNLPFLSFDFASREDEEENEENEKEQEKDLCLEAQGNRANTLLPAKVSFHTMHLSLLTNNNKYVITINNTLLPGAAFRPTDTL